MTIEEKLDAMGLVLPAELTVPEGVVLPFSFVRVIDNRAYIAGHSAQNTVGSVAAPFGKLGRELSIEQGYESAKLTALSMLASLKRELGELDRVSAWIKLFGMVNCTPDFEQHPAVINGASHLIIELYGKERGAHTRSAVGMNSLPFNIPVEIEGVVAIR